MADFDWRKQLTFSERMNVRTQMQDTRLRDWTGGSASGYERAVLGASSADALKHAKQSEESARSNASSLQEYQALCTKAVPLSVKEGRHDDDNDLENATTSNTRMGKYINVSHHSDGITSEVFKAIHPDTRQLVALKSTTPALMTPPHDSKREGRILKAAESERIIQLLDAFSEAGGHWILVFPFMPFGLDGLLRNGSITGPSRRTILRDMFSALAHLHELGIIHRDVKPSNILLASPTGPAYLTDFGIAWSPDDAASEPAAEKILDVGTTCYRPPELLFGNVKYGTKLDLWAAGCVTAETFLPPGQTLFDSGDLGSELALIKSIFETLGTPDLNVWPEAATFHDWGKMAFTRYPGKSWKEMMPGINANALDLVQNLLIFESNRRMSAHEVITHPFFESSG